MEFLSLFLWTDTNGQFNLKVYSNVQFMNDLSYLQIFSLICLENMAEWLILRLDFVLIFLSLLIYYINKYIIYL